MLPILLCTLPLAMSSPAGAEEAVEEQTNGVEVIRRGDVVLFRYRDEQGNLIIEDRPPPQYFDVEEVEVEEVEEVEPEPVVVPPPPPPAPWMPGWLVSVSWAALGLLLLSVPLIWFFPLWLQWRRETPVDRVLRLGELPYFSDVKLSLGAHTLSEVDRLVRTPAGILILGVEKLQGEIRGTATDDQWVRGTETIINPLARVRHAEKMIAKITPDVPTFGRVVDLGKARYRTGMPATVQKLNVFAGGLSAFAEGKVPDRTLDTAWRTLMRFPRANQDKPRALGVGWQGWIRRHPFETSACVVLAITVIAAIALLVAQRL